MLNCFSHVQFFATLSTAACQTPLCMGFSRQEYWSGFPCPPPGGLPSPGIKPMSPMSPALAGWFFTTSATWETPKPSRKKESEVAESCPILCNPMGCKPTRLLPPWNFPGKGTGVGCHFLLQGIFVIRGLNLGLPALRADTLPSEPPRSPNPQVHSWDLVEKQVLIH